MTEPDDAPNFVRARLNRRTVLAGALAGGAALGAAPGAAPGVRAQSPSAAADDVDVVVVGAGFAGLSAALGVAASGRSVRLVEARDRVGGRVLNHPLDDGRMIEAGGQFIGPTQNRMFELAREFGVGTYPAHFEGRIVSVVDGERRDGSENMGPGSEFMALSDRLDAMAAEVPVEAPWTAPRAADWDSMTLRSWLENNTTDAQTLGLFEGMADLWGADTRDLSLLFVLFYIAAAGDAENPGRLARLLDIPGGAQEQRFHGGSQVLAQKMAAALGEQLVLSAAVRQISWSDAGVEVVTDLGAITARRAIVAVPPGLAAGIRFEPALPTLRRQLLQRMPMGSLIKVTAIYDRPFWREAGLSGVSANAGAIIDSTFDNCLPEDSRGIILGFVGGAHSRAWAGYDEATRREESLTSLAQILGEEGRDPVDFFIQDWPGDPWSSGGPVAYAPPGVLLDYGPAIRAPVGPIHWAGTETAIYWNGYMEGAVQSGDRAAAEVLAALAG